MYAQYPRRSNVPENYSGNAFRYPPIGSLTASSDESKMPRPDHDTSARQQDEGGAVVTSQNDLLAYRPIFSDPSDYRQLPVDPSRRDEEERSLFPLNFLNVGHGIGSEELLLIGLFLLLSGGKDEGDEKRDRGDLLFYLLLLFFCG